MRTTHYEYDNHIEITFHKEDRCIIDLIREMVNNLAKAALENDDIKRTLKLIKEVVEIDEAIEAQDHYGEAKE